VKWVPEFRGAVSRLRGCCYAAMAPSMGTRIGSHQVQSDWVVGVIAAKRSRNSSGSNTSSRVPSRQAVFKWSATRPSLRSRRRSSAKGGRKT